MREVRRKAKIGEKIKIVDAFFPLGSYKNGDVLTVLRVLGGDENDEHRVCVEEFEQPFILGREYVVLEGEKEMRFKAGDKVRIVNDLNKDMGNVVEDMVSLAGKTAVVEAVGGVYYKLDIDGRCWSWEDRFLEPAPFALSDLKPCMVAKQRGGDLKIVSESKDGLVLNSRGWTKLNEYTDELLLADRSIPTLDIIEVYGFSEYDHLANEVSTRGRELLFKREEPKPKRKMTVAEICKELGEEIEIVKGE